MIRSNRKTRSRRSLALEVLENRRLLATYTVNSISNDGDSFADDGICDTANNPTTTPPTPASGICTLRAALSNAFINDGPDTIEFDVPGSASFVPVIAAGVSVAPQTTIDGTTQESGKVIISTNLAVTGDDALLKGLEVQGVLTLTSNDNSVQQSTAEGITISGDRNQIGGTGLNDTVVVLSDGLLIRGNQNVVEGSYIGFNPDTSSVDANPNGTGISIQANGAQSGATGNRIGGNEVGAGNVVGGFGTAISIGNLSLNSPVTDAANVVQGNFIGLVDDGTVIGNANSGITILAMGGNQIGGTEPGQGNVISSSNVGIQLLESASNNKIEGNFIGTTIDGSQAVANQQIGISLDSQGRITNAPSGNTIGGSMPGAGNLISGNTDFGIKIFNGPRDNVIDGNVIGISPFEDVVPNGIGIDVTFAQNNIIGGTIGNTISGNRTGVQIAGSTASGNRILGNRIGTNLDGDAAIGNNTGILINDAPGTIIGGTLPSGGPGVLGNTISGSIPIPAENVFGHGIFVVNANAQNTMIQGNRVGTNSAGTAALGNGGDGILVVDANGTVIGGTSPELSNVVSGNGGDGITLFGGNAGVADSVIEGNFVGTDAAGNAAIPNGARGVHLDSNTKRTRVGGESPSARNVISGNASDGVIIFGTAAQENEFFQNTIGLNAAGDAAIPNGAAGVLIQQARNNLLGKRIDTNVFGNLISGNLGDGVRIEESTASGNVLIGNRIGVGAGGDEQLGNRGNGVSIIDAVNNRIGPYSNTLGSFPIGGNIISDNFLNGVKIEGSATGNQVLGNGIGTAAGGTVDEQSLVLGNSENGVFIDSAANNFVGGKPSVAIPASATIPNEVDGNVIASNVFDGVRIVGDTAVGNRILGNSIFLNAQQGIDLGRFDVTENDVPPAPGVPDTDTGPNLLQNFPVIEEIQKSPNGSTVRLRSRLQTTPNQTYTVEIFSNFKRETSGQGRNLVETIDVNVGATGTAEFTVDVPAPQPVANRNGQRASFFSMTATDPNGNTSEFSPSASAPELVIEDLELTLDKITFEDGEFIFRDTVVVRNEGGRDANGVLVQFRDQDGNTLGQLDQDQFVDLPAPVGEPIDVMLDIEWHVTDLLLNSSGTFSLGITATIDPGDAIPELVDDVENNMVTDSVLVDLRPVLRREDVDLEYSPGAFLAGVNLENDVFVNAVDWNGNLPGNDYPAGVPRELRMEAGSERQSTIITGASSPPFQYSFDLGEDLSPGTTLVRLIASSFSALPPTVLNISYSQVENPSWIGDVFVTVEDVGAGPFDKVAKYHAGFGFPGFVTDGFFEIPVSVKVGAGALGPEIGTYEIDLDFRSDGVASLTGAGPWSGKIAGVSVFPPVDVEISGTAAPSGDSLDIVSLSTSVSRSAGVETPQVPLPPPVSFLSAHGELTGSLSATLSVEQGPDGTLDWQPAGFGIGVGAALKISAGFEGLAYAEGGIGGNIDANFNLPATPCLLDSVTLQFALTAEVQVLIATASYEFNFPDPPFMLAGCGSGDASQAQVASLSAPEGESNTPTLKLAESTAGSHFATLGTNGLPDIRYRYAAPSLAVADDGTKTLVWVDEDPTKPVEGQLEIVASREVNGVWQAPIAITDNSLLDVQPTVSLLPDGSPVAVWSHVSSAVADTTNPDPYALLSSMDLSYSVFDTTLGTWSPPQTLASRLGMDYLPQLTPTATGVAVTFLSDADGDTSLFPDDGRTIDSALLISEFNGTSWSAAATVASSVDATTAPQAVRANLGGGVDGFAVWESSLSGGQGMRVSIARGGIWEPTILLADEPNAASPQLIELPGAGAAGVVWLNQQVFNSTREEDTVDVLKYATFSGGTLGSVEEITRSPGISDPVLTLDGDGRVIATWVETFADAVGIGYATRDTDGTWGKPQRMEIPDGEFPWWLMPYTNDDQLNVINLSRKIELETLGEGEFRIGPIPRLTTPSLGLSTATIAPDLVADNVTTSPATGGNVQVSATITNQGDLASAAASARFTVDGSPVGTDISVSPLAPGASTVVMFEWTPPANPVSNLSLGVTADPDNVVEESDESNNQATTGHFFPNLAPANVIASLNADVLMINGDVVSNGDIPSGTSATIRLVADDPVNGEVLAETTIASVAPGESSAFQFQIDNAIASLGSARTGYVIVDAADDVSESLEGFDNREILLLNPFESWTNPNNRLDVENSGDLTVLDALIVINDLARNGIRTLPVPATPTPFLDPNADGRVSAIDALIIINQLARNQTNVASGELAPPPTESPGLPETADVVTNTTDVVTNTAATSTFPSNVRPVENESDPSALLDFALPFDENALPGAQRRTPPYEPLETAAPQTSQWLAADAYFKHLAHDPIALVTSEESGERDESSNQTSAEDRTGTSNQVALLEDAIRSIA